MTSTTDPTMWTLDPWTVAYNGLCWCKPVNCCGLGGKEGSKIGIFVRHGHVDLRTLAKLAVGCPTA